MAQDYVVNYSINVNATEAQNAISSFALAVKKLKSLQEPINELKAQINSVSAAIEQVGKVPMRIDASQAKKSLSEVTAELTTLRNAIGKKNTLTLGISGSKETLNAVRSFNSAAKNPIKWAAMPKDLQSTVSMVSRLTSGKASLGFDNTNAVRSLTQVLNLLEEIDALAKRSHTIRVYNGNSGGSVRSSAPSAPRSSAQVAGAAASGRGGFGMFGSSSGSGFGVADMAKGMGVAYGISALFSSVSGMVRDVTNYDNAMQSVRNILFTHDLDGNFGQRFGEMEQIVRNVGMETKFTAPEVADAARFLAMAGLQLPDIKQAIRPVTDIALIGDTELGQTADVLTNVMTGYGIAPWRMRNAADVMTQTFTSSNVNLLQMADSFKYIGSLAANAGVDFETAAAMIGVLGNAGRQGTQAGTDLRMMMVNMLKPNKVQAAQWKALGISTTDSFGELRPMNEIFREMRDKNVTTQQMAKLFRVTAVQGAMSLVKNVDRLDDIIAANRGASGLSSNLAEKKRDTLQGLWKQITSVFTEGGMQGFEEQQGQIRILLKEIRDFMLTDEFKKGMKTFIKDAVDLMKVVKSVSGTFLDMFHKFEPLLKVFLKWKLQVQAALLPLRMFGSLFNFGGVASGNAAGINVLANSFVNLRGAVQSANFAYKRSLFSNDAFMYQRWLQKNANPMGMPMNMGWKGRLGMMWGQTKEYGRQFGNATAPFVGNVGAMVGGALGYNLGSRVGDPGSALNIATSIGGTVGGSALMGYLGSIPGWGWAAMGLLAAGTLGYQLVKYKQSVDAACGATRDFIKTLKEQGGVLGFDAASPVERYYNLAYNKTMEANAATRERIRLLKEQMGLESEDGKGAAKSVDMETLQNAAGSISKLGATGFWGALYTKLDGYKGVRAMADQATALGFQNVWTADGRIHWAGKSWSPDEFSGILASYRGTLEGRESHDIADAAHKMWQETLNSDRGARGLENFVSELKRQYGFNVTASDIKNSKRLSASDMLDSSLWTQEDQYGDPARKLALNSKLNATLDLYKKPIEDLKVYYDAIQNHKKLTMGMVWNATMAYDPQLADKWRNVDIRKAESLMSVYGFYDGMFHETKLQDGTTISAAQNAKLLVDDFGRLTEALKSLERGSSDVLAPLLNAIGLIKQFAGAEQWYDRLPNPEKGDVRNANYRSRTVKMGVYTYKWSQSDRRWNGAHSVQPPIDETTMNKYIASGEAKQIDDSLVDDSGFGGGMSIPHGSSTTNSPSSSDYQSHYNSSVAAPKQVIVRIGNLMNVDRIDLSNKDNSAAVNNLKEQLSQVLIDVVHDFDLTYHG